MSTISIILPVYNVEDYIAKCLNSILEQTFSDFELIIVDDCCQDRSITICKNILKNSTVEHQFIYNQQNKGISESRNIGIEASESKFVTFIDPDDWIDKHMLQTLLDGFLSEKADIVSCKSNCYWENDNNFTPISNLKSGAYSSNEFLAHLFKGNVTFQIWGRLYKRSLFNSIRFPPEITFEDVLTLPYLVQKSREIIQLESHHYFYVKRKNNTSLTATKPPNLYNFLIHLNNLSQHFSVKPNSLLSASLVYIYKTLLAFTYSTIAPVKKIKECSHDLRRISSFIKYQDLLLLKRHIPVKHFIYLVVLKLNRYLFYYGYKTTLRLARFL